MNYENIQTVEDAASAIGVPLLTEEERSELSCNKYDPMDFETYLGVQQEKTRRFMMPLTGIERFFI